MGEPKKLLDPSSHLRSLSECLSTQIPFLLFIACTILVYYPCGTRPQLSSLENRPGAEQIYLPRV